MRTSLLKPGLLVSLKTALSGGVHYNRRDLPAAEVDDTGSIEGQDVAQWETTRTIDDKKEHERGVKARSLASSIIRRECSATSFGLLCPKEKEVDLDMAVVRARGLADAFNATAATTRLSVYLLKGRIAETDEEATRALASEVRELLDMMQEGINELSVKKIRDAANKARALGQMLDDSQAEKMGKAISAARTAARQIVKRVEKKGEASGAVLADINTKPINVARFAFLDLEPTKEEGDEMPDISRQRFAGLEVEEEAEARVACCSLCGTEFTLLSGDVFGCPVHGIQSPISKEEAAAISKEEATDAV